MANNIQEKNIHWFPGHMKKAYVSIEEYLKITDFVIIVLDARAPFSSANNYLIKLFDNKAKLYILNKADLADPLLLKEWSKYYSSNQMSCITMNSKLFIKKNIEEKLLYLTKEKREKNLKRGIKNALYKGMIVGVPNAGKSTILNLIGGKKRAETANKPGVTRTVNWIKISKEYYLMDTPGILTPRFENEAESIKLALIGSVRQDILPIDKIINYAYDFLKKYYVKEFASYLGCTDSLEVVKNFKNEDISCMIAQNFIPLMHDGKLNFEQAKLKFLNDFRNGKIAKVCLDRIDEYVNR